MSTISIDSVIANVKLELNSFDDAGQIDDVALLKNADWVLDKLNSAVLSKFDLVLEVEDYKTEIPFNFKSLDALYKCQVKDGGTSSYKWLLGNPLTYKVRDYSKLFCYDKCCITESHEEITRTIYIETKEETTKYCNKELLSFSENVPKGQIAPDCANRYSYSPNKFNFDDKFFYFNFKEGSVFIKYSGSLLDEDNYPQVPDESRVVKAIEDYLIYTTLKTLYYNNVADVQGRMVTARELHRESLAEAIYYNKLPSAKSLVEWGNKRANALRVLDPTSKSDYYDSRHKNAIR
jgi:hypothetical protein